MTIGVLGAGAMGGGIAQVAAAAGHTVILGDSFDGAVARAVANITGSLARDVTKGRIDQLTADSILSRIRNAGELSASHEKAPKVTVRTPRIRCPA